MCAFTNWLILCGCWPQQLTHWQLVGEYGRVYFLLGLGGGLEPPPQCFATRHR